MDNGPFGRALAAILASWERNSDLRNKDFQSPRLPVNRGFSVFLPGHERKDMNKNKTSVLTEFSPETRFKLRPTPPVPFRVARETKFERLKNQLLARQLAEAPAPELSPPLRRAANEAAALAWATLFPLLVFPVLFEEKIDTALRQAERQARIYAGSRELVAV
jgi:hypothetical protein